MHFCTYEHLGNVYTHTHVSQAHIYMHTLAGRLSQSGLRQRAFLGVPSIHKFPREVNERHETDAATTTTTQRIYMRSSSSVPSSRRARMTRVVGLTIFRELAYQQLPRCCCICQPGKFRKSL